MASQLYQFKRTSETIYHELGSWAAAEYMYTSIMRFKEYQREDAEANWSPNTVKDFTMQILCDLDSLEQPRLPIMPADLSPKCRVLLQNLSQMANHDFHGLIFVAQRATVMILKSLIEQYPNTKDNFRCETFVGMSNNQSRTDLGKCHNDINGQEDTLKRFRTRKLNLIITTNALEEGIDIPACNTVICFDRPLSIRSFVQRRGRAREGESTFIVFVGNKEDEEGLGNLMKIEDVLVKTYQDDTRAVFNHPLQAEPCLSLQVKNTGAHLNMMDAVSHLNIFCAKLPKQPYIGNQPLYHHEESDDSQVRAIISLTSALHPSLQQTKGLRWWSSKKLANADAALQAYKALWAAGLVNDYLLPTKLADLVDSAFISSKTIHFVSEPINPWAEMAARWNLDEVDLYAHRVQIQHPRKESLELMMIIPLQIQRQIQFPLFLNDNTTIGFHLSPGSLIAPDNQFTTLYRQVTHLILQSVYEHLLQPRPCMDFVALFVPDAAPAAMQAFLDAYSGRICLDEAMKTACRTRAALYIPCITHEIGVYMVAEQLREKVLSGMSFRSIDLLSVAIRPTCSGSPARFRSLASVGATFLKYITSEQLFLHHPAWHEGLLSRVKEAIISDCGLAQAARMCGLERFLITRRFNGKKWKPAWVSNLLSPPNVPESRKVSARTLGEMVRAIVGAAYTDGGRKQAANCAAALVPAIKTWHAAVLSDGSFEQNRPGPMTSYSLALGEMEKLLGYKFTDRSLLVEALTHSSYYASGLPQTTAYGRLSFLGDAVLELVVTQSLLYAPIRTMSVDRLQSLRTAVTNNLFLTFVCLEFHLEVESCLDEVPQPTLSRTVDARDEVYLWTCLQSHSQELTTGLSKFRLASRHDCWRIQRALLRTMRYPWADLAAMGGHSVLSDIVKSVLGAVFVDSRASLQDCRHLADRMGILRRAKQFCRDDVITDHPKVLLQKLNPGAKIVYQIYTIPKSERVFCCAVWLNGEKAIDVQEYPNRDAAVVSAAQSLARLLQQKPRVQ
ncbi:hypothetical protein N7481_003190 [Penicillium waksmanii]|uniref:uncharacterized protein n=1 Tax=Penicillium waksmanii TaxID=69791 RepID=UPI0025465B50|nr:uncharacterized protein N7481_003190 [Penicillium waksmanii]KAJ5987980.1 hypothetical protein N7481_003190 [Penicillium waksmanii]